MATTAALELIATKKFTVALQYISRKFCSFYLLSFSALALLAILVAQPLRDPAKLFDDPDMWWHLANARNLFTTHRFVFAEPYAFTVAGQRWINPEWGAEIPYWLAYHTFHLQGIYFVTWLLVIANLAFLYLRSLRKTVNPWPALFASIVGLGLLTVNAGPRTILCGYLCLSALLLIIDTVEKGSTRWLPAVPALFLLWVNLHGSWIIGLALLGSYIGCGFISFNHGLVEQERRGWLVQKSLLIAFGASCAAVFVNPYGWGLVWNPFDMMWKQPLNITTIEEWKPLDLHWFVGKIMVASIAILLIATLLKVRKWKLYELLFVGFAWYAAFSHVRFTLLAAVIMAPWIAESLGAMFWAEPEKQASPSLNALFSVAFLTLAFMSIPTESALAKALAAHYPNQAIQALKPGWRNLNEYGLGGMLTFQGKADFIDSRVDTFEHHGVFRDYLDLIQIRNPLELLNKYKIDHVLFEEQAPLVFVLERTTGWRVALRDGKFVLLERYGVSPWEMDMTSRR
jgi:hypothetical protein